MAPRIRGEHPLAPNTRRSRPIARPRRRRWMRPANGWIVQALKAKIMVKIERLEERLLGAD